MKKLVSMLLVCIMVFSMAGCSKEQGTNESSSTEQSTVQNSSETSTDENTENSGSQNDSDAKLSLKALSSQMLIDENLGFAILYPTEADMLTELIGLDLNTISQSCFSDAIMTQSYTLYLAEAISNEYVDGIKKAFENRLSQIQKSFENYLPDAYELSLKGQIVTNGNYVMLVICENIDKAIETFNTAVQTQSPTAADFVVKLEHGDIQGFVEHVTTDEIISFGMSFDSDSAYISEALGIDLNKLNQYRFVEPGRANASTLYVVEVGSSDYVNTIKEAFEKQLLQIQQRFQRYLEDQYEIALKGQVIVNGNYVMLIVTQNSEPVIELFNSITQ